MAICSFFLQGRCRFGDKCWNEHPREGGGGGRNQSQSQDRYHYQAPPQGVQKGNFQTPPPRYVQPSSFSKSTTWTNKDNTNSSFGSFPRPTNDNAGSRNFNTTGASGSTYQNRFSALRSHDQVKDAPPDKEGNVLGEIVQDMLSWESSGQWLFSVYSVVKEKRNISGFTDISPEELRLVYYASKNEGNLQNYMNSLQLLVSQWKQRILELKNPSTSTKAALLSELSSDSTNTAPAPGFGGIQKPPISSSGFSTSNIASSLSTFSFKPETGQVQSSGTNTGSAFGSKPTAASFSFAQSTAGTSTFSGFGSSSTIPGFGTSSSTGTAPGFGTTTSGFGSVSNTGFGAVSGTLAASGFGVTPGTTVASGFGGATSATGTSGFGGKTVAPGFGGGSGTNVAPGFGGVSGTTVGSGFGSKSSAVADLFKPTNVSTSTTSIFGQPTVPSASSTQSTTPASSTTDGTSNALFTPRTVLSAEDIQQYEAKKFTLGKIPILPPPADLLII
ncbi:nucleoporin NUP42 [Discoglossus pictus]